MSNLVNENLLAEASFHCDYWEGTLWAEIIRHDVEQSDLDLLRKHLKESKDAIFLLEYNPSEVGDTY